MKAWNELNRLEQLAITHWDLYKDAHGVRPRWLDTSQWDESDFELAVTELYTICDRNERMRIADEAAAFEIVKARITALQEMHGFDWNEAVNWLHAEYETNGDQGYLEFQLGIAYGALTLKD
jgi:hypothetical protein